MKRWIVIVCIALLAIQAKAQNRIYDAQVKTLQAMVGQDWLSYPAVLRLDTDDVLHVSFDQLSHTYHRYVCHVSRHEADWKPASEVFESDWLEGFNDFVIDDSETSLNTIVPYTHYQFQLPNPLCRLKLSGNYRLSILDADDDDRLVATVDFMVCEQQMTLSLQATTNTDIDLNQSHQQLSVALNYGSLRVTNPDEQIRLVVLRNGRSDTRRTGIAPTYRQADGLQWSHCRELIFDAGNEYRKYEILDPSHPTMGIDHIAWDGEYYQVWPFLSQPRPNYLYDEDADGAFYVRNSDNRENDIASEYVFVNYRLQAPPVPDGCILIDGQFATTDPSDYVMHYDPTDGLYHAQILQKQGYYSYQYLWLRPSGQRQYLPSEGNYYQTENRYQALVYYKGTGERTWRLTAFRGIELVSSDMNGRTQR